MEPRQDKVRLFATDLDGTILGNLEAAQAFRETWNSLPAKTRPLLCYNTGRLLDDTQHLIEDRILPEPDLLICGVGTVIFDFKEKKAVKAFSQVLEEGWNRTRVQEIVLSLFPRLEEQPKYYQNKHKSSWYFEDMSETDLEKLDNALTESGMETNIVYSSNRDLDILPRYANKGNALSWLCRHLDIKRGMIPP